MLCTMYLTIYSGWRYFCEVYSYLDEWEDSVQKMKTYTKAYKTFLYITISDSWRIENLW